MKKIMLFIGLALLTVVSFSQAKKQIAGSKPTAAAKPGPAKKPVVTNTVQLKSSMDSFSYAVGLSMAGFYREQGVKNININLVIKALNDSKAGKPLLDDTQTNNCIVSFMQEVKSVKASGSKKEGEAFLAENKTKPGVITLPSGLQYQVLKEGTGAKPGPADKVKVHYEGSLIGGKIFDSSIQRGEPIELNVNGVIPGWTEALQLMPVGSKWKLFIPSELGYGDNGAGADIKPGSALIFDVELLDIVK